VGVSMIALNLFDLRRKAPASSNSRHWFRSSTKNEVFFQTRLHSS